MWRVGGLGRIIGCLRRAHGCPVQSSLQSPGKEDVDMSCAWPTRLAVGLMAVALGACGPIGASVSGNQNGNGNANYNYNTNTSGAS